MTVSSTIRRAGPFIGGSSFPFSFKVFSKTDVKVVVATAAGVESTLVLDSDYSVSLNTDQDNSPGGTVTLLVQAIPFGGKLVIIGDIAFEQSTDITNQGGFFPQVVEDALDRATIQIQQLVEQQNRALTMGATDTRTGEQVVAALFAVQSAADASAAAALANLREFRGIYYGPLSIDPTLDPNGNAPTIGDFYFNTSTNTPRVLTSAGWSNAVTAAPVSFTQQLLSGNNVQTSFTLATTPASTTSFLVFISGVVQRLTTDYSISGNTLTFTSPPPTGTNNITVVIYAPVNVGVPNDGSVTTAKLADGAITPPKLSTGAPSWTSGGSLSAGVNGANLHDFQGALRSSNASLFGAALTGGGTAVTGSGIDLGTNQATPTETYVDFVAQAGSDFDARISRDAGANGTMRFTNNGVGGMLFTVNGISSLTIANGANFTAPIPPGTVSTPVYWCRAWANFNGAAAGSTRGSGNIALTRTATGTYNGTFTQAMNDANWAMCATGYQLSGGVVTPSGDAAFTKSATGFTNMKPKNTGGTVVDVDYLDLAIFR